MELKHKKTGEKIWYSNGVAKSLDCNFVIECDINMDYWEPVKDVRYDIQDISIKGVVSIKRLSDGVTFSVGDQVKSEGGKPTHEIAHISIGQRAIREDLKGWVYSGIDEIWFDWEGGEGGDWMVDTIKIEEPFTMVRGIKVKEGEKFYFVSTKNYGVNEATGGHFKKEHPERIKFLTKEEAEMYAKWNKPVFAPKDLKGLLTDSEIEGLLWEIGKK